MAPPLFVKDKSRCFLCLQRTSRDVSFDYKGRDAISFVASDALGFPTEREAAPVTPGADEGAVLEVA